MFRTKINYNPQETVTFHESEDLEVIEIQNIGNTNADLTGINLIELGISYQFPKNVTIAARKYLHLVGNATTFQDKSRIIPFDTFTINLSNKNHNLVSAIAFENLIDQVEYSDKVPWPETADGDGFYLELINVNSDNTSAINWVARSSEVLSTTDFDNTNFMVFPSLVEDR